MYYSNLCFLINEVIKCNFLFIVLTLILNGCRSCFSFTFKTYTTFKAFQGGWVSERSLTECLKNINKSSRSFQPRWCRIRIERSPCMQKVWCLNSSICPASFNHSVLCAPWQWGLCFLVRCFLKSLSKTYFFGHLSKHLFPFDVEFCVVYCLSRDFLVAFTGLWVSLWLKIILWLEQ